MEDVCQLLDKSRQGLGVCGEVPVFTPGRGEVMKGSVRSLWNRLGGGGGKRDAGIPGESPWLLEHGSGFQDGN